MSVLSNISGIARGIFYFNNPDDEVEALAKDRVNTCKDCEHIEEETISFLRVNDKRITEASGKMCGDCGCVLSYKLRQNDEVCKYWKK